MRSGDRAWLALGVGVAAYEIAAKDDELMSEAMDRYLVRHPWLCRGIVAVLALHLTNCIKPRYDPLYWLFSAKQRLLRSTP